MQILKRHHLPVNSIATCKFQIARFGREEAIANPWPNEQEAERCLVQGEYFHDIAPAVSVTAPVPVSS